MTATRPRTSNILTIILILLILLMIALQVYIVTEIHRPILRPGIKPPTQESPLRGLFGGEEACNLFTIQSSCILLNTCAIMPASA